MTAAELREALDRWDGWPHRGTPLADGDIHGLADAARLWLRILEGDEQTVEKVAHVLRFIPEAKELARAVLAALAEGEKQ